MMNSPRETNLRGPDMVGDRYLVVVMGDSDVRPRMVSRVTQTDNTRITTRFGYCRSDIDSLNPCKSGWSTIRHPLMNLQVC